MNFGKIFGNIGKGLLKGADIGAKTGVPVLTQIDGVADTIKDIKGKRKVDMEAIEKIAGDLQELKSSIPKEKPAAKKIIESNRFKATVIGLIVSAGAHYGLPAEIANQIGEIVFYFIATYVVADTLRPSFK